MRTLLLMCFAVLILAVVVVTDSSQAVTSETPTDQDQLRTVANDSLYPINVAGHLFLNFLGASVAEGNYFYSAQPNGLLVFDLTDPSSPSEYGSLYIEGGTFNTAIGVSGALAAIVQQSERELTLIDISNPASPSVVGKCSVEVGFPNVIEFVGQHVYVGTHYRLKVVDVSQPANPVVTDSMMSLGWLTSIAVHGNHVYLADKDQIRILDITDPSHPTVVGSSQAVNSPKSLVVAGSILYCVEPPGKVVALDLSNPLVPLRLGAIEVSSLVSIAVSGTNVFASRGFQNATYILNFDTPSQPYKVGEMPEDCYTLVVSSDKLIMTESETSSIWDISLAESPVLLGQFSAPHNEVTALAITDNVAALATGDLLLIDISDPLAPAVAGTYSTSGYGIYDVATYGGQAFVTDHAGLEIVDISDPANPTQVGRLNHCCYAAVVDAEENLAVAASGPGFIVVDITDRQHPSLITEVVLDDTLQIGDVRLHDEHAYIMLDGIDNTCRLLLYDLTNPSQPTYAGEFVSSLPQGQSKALLFASDTAFYLSSFVSLDIVSVANPDSPHLIAHAILAGEDLVKLGDYLLLANNGIRIIDLYNLNFMQTISWRNFGGQPRAITAAGGYVYLATGDGFWTISGAPTPLLIGDANNDGMIDISDVVFEISFIFSGGEEPFPYRLGDTNCDRTVDISDAVYLIAYIFSGGPLPCSN